MLDGSIWKTMTDSIRSKYEDFAAKMESAWRRSSKQTDQQWPIDNGKTNFNVWPALSVPKGLRETP